MAALPFIGYISQSAQADVTFAIDTVRYGDGYEQRAPKGLKTSYQSWNITCEGLTLSTYQSLLSAAEASGGVTSFTWTPPGSASSRNFVIRSYSATAMSGDIYSISAKLEEVV